MSRCSSGAAATQVLVAALLAGCMHHERSPVASSEAPSAGLSRGAVTTTTRASDTASAPMSAAAPLSLDVPGTAQTLTLVPIPRPAGDPAIWMSQTEITWNLFDVFVYRLDESTTPQIDAVSRPSKPYISMDRGFGHDGYPAISMSYQGADAFCRWLSARTGRRFRLPSEREWTGACRSSGLDATRRATHAWTRENAENATHPVGTRPADALGLHDLWGNAAEWCTGDDGQPVTCGGSFRDAAAQMDCGLVARPSPSWNASDPQFPKSTWWLADAGFVGFRVVLESEEGPNP